MYIEDYLPAFMFGALAILLFSGFPVGFVLGGVALGFGFLGAALDVFHVIQFFNLPLRIWGIADNLVLVAIPMFIFMGTMLERSGVAADLLYCLQVLLRRTPGGLALAVTVMGTILAATTGIIGASVVMISLMALPVMLQRKYNMELATGTIASSGTLGILIPPSIMLVIMADLLGRSVGTLFVAAVFPGLMLAGLYFIYILTLCRFKPHLAPPLPKDMGPKSTRELIFLLLRGFIPAVFLILLVLGSIVLGWATPTEAAGVGAFGAVLLAVINRKLSWKVLRDVVERTALTNGMLFFIFVGATAFSYVFRSLGGDQLIEDLVYSVGVGPWGILFIPDDRDLSPGILLRLDRDHADRAAGIRAHPRRPRLRRPRAQARGGLLFSILMAVNLQTSFLTPPFGFALFYMKGVARPKCAFSRSIAGSSPS